MTFERLLDLKASTDGVEFTEEEVNEGWHLCPQEEGAVVGPRFMHDPVPCKCNDPTKRR